MAAPPDVARMSQTRQHAVGSFDLLADIARDLRPGVIFPTCFDVLLHMRRALRAPDASLQSITPAILLDPLVCARVLRRANNESPKRPVTGIRNALAVLGADKSRRIAQSISSAQIASAAHLVHVDKLSHRLWQHTLRSAAGAFVIARRLTPLDPDEAMTAALLHDIGAFYLLDRLARYRPARLQTTDINALILEWHESIGESLLHSLRLPAVLIDAMRDHEQPRTGLGTPRTLADVVFLANVLAGGASELYGDPVCHVSQRPGPARERFAGLLPEIDAEYAALRGVPAGG